MRDWVVGGALIVSDEGLLLVQNRRRNGAHDWTPPGGVIDEGESPIDGLTREVREETGLRVTEWSGPLYEVRREAPDLGSRLRVEATLAVRYEGHLLIDDPARSKERHVEQQRVSKFMSGCLPYPKQ